MSVYIPTSKFSGQHFLDVVSWVNKREAEIIYHAAGWNDHMVKRVKEHLEFSNKDTAILFILTFGGEAQDTIPYD